MIQGHAEIPEPFGRMEGGRRLFANIHMWYHSLAEAEREEFERELWRRGEEDLKWSMLYFAFYYGGDLMGLFKHRR